MGNLQSKLHKSYISTVTNLTPSAADSHYSKKSGVVRAEKYNDSVVLICCCDAMGKVLERCTGFFAADSKGHLITASHAIFDLTKKDRIKKYDRVVIGKITKRYDGSDTVSFIYYADVVAEDVERVDACVLLVKGKFDKPLEIKENEEKDLFFTREKEIPMKADDFRMEQINSLHLDIDCGIEGAVLSIGFEQANEDAHVNQRISEVKGNVIDSCSNAGNMNVGGIFSPTCEIVLDTEFPLRMGFSGGPCFNADGYVIGIVSGINGNSEHTAFLAPLSEWKGLLENLS